MIDPDNNFNLQEYIMDKEIKPYQYGDLDRKLKLEPKNKDSLKESFFGGNKDTYFTINNKKYQFLGAGSPIVLTQVSNLSPAVTKSSPAPKPYVTNTTKLSESNLKDDKQKTSWWNIIIGIAVVIAIGIVADTVLPVFLRLL